MNRIRVVCMAVLVSALTWADEQPRPDDSAFSVSLVPGVQSTSVAQDVKGCRLSFLVGQNRNVSMLDIGLLGCLVDDRAYGLQLSGFYGRVKRAEGLLQAALLDAWCGQDFQGMQLAGVFAKTEGTFKGFSLAGINSANTVRGLQAGFVNFAEVLGGMQFGLVNYAKEHDEGVQIGLVNIMPESDIPVMAFLNIGF